MARKRTRFWHPARRFLLELQERSRAALASDEVSAKLEDVRPRLQHYLRAMYGESVSIEPLSGSGKPGLIVRTLKSMQLVKERGASESDASCMRLPPVLPIQRTSVPPLDQYRVLAVQHAERMRRASALHARDVSTDLERDLYELAESATIDAQIVATQPGLRNALDTARAEALLLRPKPRWRTDIEIRMEEIFRGVWNAVTDSPQANNAAPPVPLDGNAESNATWARRTAVELEAKFGRKAARAYRRMPDMTLWHTTITAKLPDSPQMAIETQTRLAVDEKAPDAANTSTRSAMPGGAQSKNSQQRGGNSKAKSEDSKAAQGPKSENADGETGGDQPKDQSSDNDKSDSSPEKQSDKRSDSDSDDAGKSGTLQTGGSGGGNTTPAVTSTGETVDDTRLTGLTFRYPEWDANARAWNPAGTIVRVMPPAGGGWEWAKSALTNHAREVQQAKRQFERLRSNRERLRRQIQGDEIDLEACVEAMVDRRMGVAPTDRLYQFVKPGRRELAITLLIDMSGSTGDAVADKDRVIDIERIAALVATAAFDALGDDYSIMAFSSASASNVRVHTLKDFGERSSPTVLQRIGALAPNGTTRLGAAVRHATATLRNHPAPHRLLLILSDGKPYDYDYYFVDYAVQDSRRAVMSARLDGIHPFCITVDTSDDEDYLAEIFGTAGYRVVSRPSQLASAMLSAVERMIGSGR